MSLNNLPAELTTRIVAYLTQLEATIKGPFEPPKTIISQYASTSINIRHAVETQTFSKLKITSNDLPEFESLVTRSEFRQALLRDLDFEPILPDLRVNALASTRAERRAARVRDKEAFSAVLVRLFAALAPRDKIEGAAPLCLLLRAARSPTNLVKVCRVFGLEDDAFHYHYDLEFPPSLPTLNNIAQLNAYHGQRPRLIAPGSYFSLLENLPRVKCVRLSLVDYEKRFPRLRKRLRIDLGKALSSSRCSMLTELSLDFDFYTPYDQRFTGPDMRVSLEGKKHDAFSLGLQRFISSCPTLADVRLGNPLCVDETLFWSPTSGTEDGRWPSLKHFRVDISCVRPDGGWYLDESRDFPREEPHRQHYPDSDSDHDSVYSLPLLSDDTNGPIPSEDVDAPSEDSSSRDPHRNALRIGDAYFLNFRAEPTEALERIWLAIARAVAAMPELCSMTVEMKVPRFSRTNDEETIFGFSYNTTGWPRYPQSIPVRVPQIYWEAPSGWTMNKDLGALWRKVIGPTGEAKYDHW